MNKKIVFAIIMALFSISGTCFSAQKVILQLRWDHQFQFAGYYAAKWQGYYDAVDIDVDIKSAVTANGILSAVKEVSQGRAQFGIGSADILKAIDDGNDLVLVASIFQHSAAGFYSRKETVITSPADFLKLKVARRVNDLIDIEFQAMLKAEGIDPDRIKAYPHQPGMDHLISGAVDVAPGYLINIPFTAFTKGIVINEFRPIKYGIDFYGDSIFTHQRIVENNPDLVERFKSASIKGWEYALNNKDELVKRISTELIRVKTVDNLERFNSFQSQSINTLIHYPEVETGLVNPARWERMSQYLVSLDILKNPIDLNRFIFNPDKLEKIKSQRIQKILIISIITVSIFLLIGLLWLRTMRSTVKMKTEALLFANESLKSNEEKYRMIYNSTPAMMHSIDNKGFIISVSDYWTKTLGFNREEVIGKKSTDFLTEKSRRDAEKIYLPYFFKNGYVNDAQYQFKKKNGENIDVLLSAVSETDNDNKIIRSLAVLIDVTEKRQIENTLKKTEEQFQLAMDASQDGLYDWDLVTNEIYYSPGWKRMLGYQDHELANDFSIWETLTEPEDVKRSWEMQQELIQKKRDRFELEFKMKHKKGHWVSVLSRAKAIFDDNGQAIRIIGTHVDITQREQMEAALRESELRFRKLFDEAPFPYQSLNEQGDFIAVNNAWLSTLGYSRTDVIGKNFSDFLEPEWKEHFKDNLPQFKTIGEVLGVEFVMVKKDGSQILVSFQGRIGKNTAGEFKQTHCVFHDITAQQKAEEDKKRLKQQLLQAQKMESIGKLAGGIAHDFNNILYPIIGFTQMTMEDLPKQHAVQENLKDVLDGAKRARDLVKRILLFSRQKDQDLKPRVIRPVIEETMNLLRSTIPVNIDIQYQLYDGQDCVLCDETEIHEIVMNLCTNAYHAMENIDGSIVVSLNKTKPSPDLNLQDTEYLCLSVSDTGIGIPKERVDKIFEPYYTTKDIGKGSGLGLSVVHGIVKSYNGVIQIEKNQDKGSVFNVFLPIAFEPVNIDQETEKDNLLGGTEKILFVDDEKSIVKLGTRSLERLGYEVVGEQNSLKALELFTSDPEKYDLVITDMAMPGMVGTQFAKKIIEICPNMPIIICSGYSEKLDREKVQQLNIKAVIDKPILIEDLTAKVREILDQKRNEKV